MMDPLLRQALLQLGSGGSEPDDFERVGRWRRACGDGAGAARWQLWSLMPPPAAELQQALAELWISLGELAQAEALLPAEEERPSWSRLALLQRQGAWDQAVQLQEHLLRDPPALEQSQLLALAATWQQAQQPDQALALLEALLAHYQRHQRPIDVPLANAVAQLLEQQRRPEVAAEWWRHSLQQDPRQIHPMMRLAREALRLQQPEVAVHYLRRVLEQDPQHPWAPDLLRQALAALGARGSLALFNGGPLPQPWRRRQRHWLEPLELVLGPNASEGLLARRPVAQLPEEAWRNVSALALWGDADGLVAAPLLLRSEGPLELWLLASPEPLLQAHNIARLLPPGSAVQVRSWPSWDPSLHASVQVLVDLTTRDPHAFQLPPGASDQPLIWRRRGQRWQSIFE